MNVMKGIARNTIPKRCFICDRLQTVEQQLNENASSGFNENFLLMMANKVKIQNENVDKSQDNQFSLT